MQSDLPKQFMNLSGRPILMHTIERFSLTIPQCSIVVVLPSDYVHFWEELCAKHTFTVEHRVCTGGENRFESVRNGLQWIGDASLVAIHDGVRPLVSRELIERTIADAQALGAVIPVVTPVDSMREVDDHGNHIVNRTHYRIVQTPQVFRADILRVAYARPYDPIYTDDASVVESAGGKIYLCEGSCNNLKITTPVDLLTAESLLKL